MKFSDLLLLAFHNLMLHKVRSLLTSLGIIFGVGSVIAMLAISEGAKREALQQIESMGVDQIILATVKPPPSGQNTTDSSNSSAIQSYGLTHNDLLNIRKMDNVKSAATARNARKKIVSGTTRLDVALFGVTDDFPQAARSEVTEGRWFSPADRNLPVCVIGVDAKRSLFPLSQRHVVGENISVDMNVFRIVGVLENTRGTALPGIGSPNKGIYIPVKTSQALIGTSAKSQESHNGTTEVVEYDTFLIKVLDVAYIDDTAKRISAHMKKTHGESEDWSIMVPLEILKQREQTQNIFTIVMSSIAGISLLVGGIGIMNIMLANVYERRKEIGTRRALGAQKADVILQFLAETVFLTTLGGALGVASGIGIAYAVTAFAAWPVVFSTNAIILSLGISAVTGILFGTYPAWKAAQQNPIDVLRSE